MQLINAFDILKMICDSHTYVTLYKEKMQVWYFGTVAAGGQEDLIRDCIYL